MAMDMILEIDGVKGESKVKGHTDQIDVLAWSWGSSNSGTFHQGGGGGGGKANVQDLSITKWVDKASCDLLLAACNGKHFKKATLRVRKAGENPLEYLTITMEPILITSYHTGGSGGEDKLTENATLNFQKVKVEYKIQDDKGGGKPAGNMTFDVAAGVK